MYVARGIVLLPVVLVAAFALAPAGCVRSTPELTVEPTASPAQTAPAPEPDPEIEELNLDFERGPNDEPTGWTLRGDGYAVGISSEAHSGQRSLELSFVEPKGDNAFGVAIATYPVERARGHRLTLRGYIRTEDVSGGYAGLWMRVDGADDDMLAFDNMGDRGVEGTTQWQPFEVTLEVPPEAVNVAFGALLTGRGVAHVDGLSFERKPLPVPPSEVTVAGTVVGPGDAPVPGAYVAVMPDPYGTPIVEGSTKADGSFSFTVAPGAYRLTISAPGFVAQTPSPRPYKGEDRPTTVTLEAGGTTIEGRVLDERGEPLGGVSVWVISTDFVSPPLHARADADGRYRIDVPTDRPLVLSVDSDTAYSDYHYVRSEQARTLDLPAIRREPAPEAVVDELRRRTIPLSGVTAGAGFDDMEPLRRLVGKARVVGLGEATHGTREFFQMKHRMLEFLVERMGFSVFAIEASFTHTMVVNDYVLHGKGSADDGLDAMRFWTWHTEEVRDLIEWVRAYNLDPAHKTKIEFLGVDMQMEQSAAEVVAAYLGEVDPELEGAKAALEASPSDVVARFDRNRKDYVARSSERWARARQHAVVYGQWKQMQDASRADAFDIRDRAMADNVRWILDTKPRGTKIVLWAHNGHVGRNFMSFHPMGRHLKEALGSRYRIFGFAFGDGGFQAIGSSKRTLKAWEVGEPPPESFDAALRRAGCSVCVLDLRGLPSKGALAKWLALPRIGRSIGAMFNSAKDMEEPFAWPQTYDAVIYVDRTTRARPAQPPG